MGQQWFIDTIAAVKKSLDNFPYPTGDPGKPGYQAKMRARARRVGYLNRLQGLMDRTWGGEAGGGTTPGAAYNSNWLNDLITWRSRD
jgi:hypothetical protein